MPTYLHPGVYVEEIPSGARPIESAGTSTAAIIGFAAKGPIGKPTLIFSWKQYQQTFGGIQSYHGETIDVDYMGHTVQAFFSNGGGKAYIVRLAPGATPSSSGLAIPGTLTGTTLDAINVEAKSSGVWANDLVTKLTVTDSSTSPITTTLSIGQINSDGEFESIEDITGLQLAGDLNLQSSQEAIQFVNTNSKYVNFTTDSATVNSADLSAFETAIVTSTADIVDSNGDLIPLTGSTPEPWSKLKKFKIRVDGANAVQVDVGPPTQITSLAEVAQHIETTVAAVHPGFTCTVAGNKLCLTSGTSGATSRLVIAGASNTDKTDEFLRIDGQNQTGANSAKKGFNTIGSTTTLAGGSNGSVPVSKADYDPVFAEFKDNRNINIVLIPDHAYDKADPASKSILDAAKAHCEATKNRMVILDPPKGLKLISEGDFKPLGMPSSTYTATYYPWVEVANPHYHPEKRAHLSPTYLVPPSGFAAGMWAKTDGRRGVWKAPAGLQTGLTGAVRTEFVVGDDAQDQLNPIGVNCYRTILTEPVIWGTRTLATRADPEWRYVPIRRTAMMIEESIYRGIQWAVFEPNDHNLWGSLRLNIETFMDGLHRSGAFQGEKASDAYFVQCGLGSTMTQGDIDAGRVIVEVGFAPLKPAEFVIVRIQQKTAQL